MAAFDQVTLRTERLVLRPLHADDAQALFEIFSDPRVARHLSRPAWTSIDQAHTRIGQDADAMADGTLLRLGLERHRDRALVGECLLFNFVPTCRRAEIGYALAHAAWGQGLMHEALVALIDFGFAQLNLNRIEADIDPRNAASAKTLARLHFVREGLLRERWIVQGEISDTALYGLLARDWQARHAAPADRVDGP
jgi:RimJ/RimL family protein N-acetyltransferase